MLTKYPHGHLFRFFNIYPLGGRWEERGKVIHVFIYVGRGGGEAGGSSQEVSLGFKYSKVLTLTNSCDRSFFPTGGQVLIT